MRLFVFLLLVANALLFAWSRVGGAGADEPDRLGEQVHPERIRLLTAREVNSLGLARRPANPAAQPQNSAQDSAQGSAQDSAKGLAQDSELNPASTDAELGARALQPSTAAPAPAGVAVPTDVCVTWGPFSDTERAKAQSDLASLKLGAQLSRRAIAVGDTWWVSVEPFSTRAGAERRAAELKAQAIDDLSVVDAGGGAFAVSLGIFRTESAAAARVAALAARGVTGTHVEPRKQALAQTQLVVRNPAPNVSEKLRELQGRYAGTALSSGACTS